MISFKKSVSQDTVKEIKIDCMEGGSVNLYDMDGFVSVRIGKVVISKYPDESVALLLDDGVGREYTSQWNLDVGKILYDDIKHKKYDNIYEYSNNEYKVLLKKVCDDDNFESYEDLPVITIGDFDYVVIKKIDNESSYSEKDYSVIYEQTDESSTMDEQDDSDLNEDESITLFE